MFIPKVLLMKKGIFKRQTLFCGVCSHVVNRIVSLEFDSLSERKLCIEILYKDSQNIEFGHAISCETTRIKATNLFMFSQ
jgi:hypothetical protein